MENKKAELTSRQIVIIIILIVSFSIILIFYFSLNLGSGIGKDACKNSVILRGTVPFGKNVVSLNCKTQKVCISKNGDCGVAGIDENIKVKDKEEIIEVLGELMRDCWWMMGEGKINYVPSSIELSKTNYCAICSVVYFGDELKEDDAFKKITPKELYFYLANKKVSGEDYSYLYYLTKLQDINSARDSLKNVKGAGDIFDDNFGLNLSKPYALVTGISKTGWGVTLGSGLFGAAVGFAIGGGPLGALLGATGAGGFAYYTEGPGEIKSLSPLFVEYNSENLQKLECEEFSTLA